MLPPWASAARARNLPSPPSPDPPARHGSPRLHLRCRRRAAQRGTEGTDWRGGAGPGGAGRYVSLALTAKSLSRTSTTANSVPFPAGFALIICASSCASVRARAGSLSPHPHRRSRSGTAARGTFSTGAGAAAGRGSGGGGRGGARGRRVGSGRRTRQTGTTLGGGWQACRYCECLGAATTTGCPACSVQRASRGRWDGWVVSHAASSADGTNRTGDMTDTYLPAAAALGGLFLHQQARLHLSCVPTSDLPPLPLPCLPPCSPAPVSALS